MSLETYRERVKKLARERKGEPIYNGSVDHAAIIVESMFAEAKSYVHILSEGLNPRVYGPDDVVEQAKLCLAEPNRTMKILIEINDLDRLKTHPYFDELADSKNLEVRFVPSELQARYDFHLLVMDGDSFRFEQDKSKHEAIAAFGDSKSAANLESLFQKIWGLSEENKVDLKQLSVTNN